MLDFEHFCTYRQCGASDARRHCPFLSAAEKDAVLGGNAAQLFNLV